MKNIIHSSRLDLIPMTPAFLRASLEGNLRKAQSLAGISLPSDWPQAAHRTVLKLRLHQLEENIAAQPWLLRIISLRRTAKMVGHIGFHTGPNPNYLQPYSPGAIEFGFTVFKQFRRRGYAREASIALMNWANRVRNLQKFVLTIRSDNRPSQALAAQLGFVKIGSHIDEEDGLEEIFERKVTAI